jgi:enoyl-[acyl-carrier protein] reductase II
MVSAFESPVHRNWKDTIIDGAETGTIMLNQRHSPALRAIRTERSAALQFAEHNVFGDFGIPQDLYFGGDMNAAIALGGQVMGRIDSIEPVATVIENCMNEFGDVLNSMADTYLT